MSLFGGVDLGTPSQRQERMLRNDLELRTRNWDRPGYLYRGGADLCLRHGKFRPGRVLPSAYRPLWKLSTTCFLNALVACEADPSLRYCEGYATIGQGCQITHGWCIAPDDGVLEVTYPTDGAGALQHTVTHPNLRVLPPERWGYWGVTFTAELARSVFERYHCAGLLDRGTPEVLAMTGRFAPEDIHPGHDYPLLRLPYLPWRTGLPDLPDLPDL